MTYDEAINHPECPQWLKEAEVEWADIRISDDGHVVWERGLWKDGIWNGGLWKDGIWERGLWRDGIWNGGTWKDGIWNGGIWNGGLWKDGIWKDGLWKGGLWKDGLWKGGYRSPMCKWTVTVSDDGKVRIGCKEKTIQEWDAWFAGTEEFDTPRGTEAFRMIEANYLAVKAYVQHMQHLNKEQ